MVWVAKVGRFVGVGRVARVVGVVTAPVNLIAPYNTALNRINDHQSGLSEEPN